VTAISTPSYAEPAAQTTQAQRWLYGLMMLGMQIPSQIFGVYLLFFYTDVKRLPAEWSGAALTIYAIYNAINNPLIGYLQDRTRSPLGRRIPYLRFGALPWLVMFAALWLAPFDGNQQPVALLIYFVVCLVIYDGLGTAVGTAYYSLMPEMFPNYKERTDVAARMNIFLTVALLLGVALPPVLSAQIGWGPMGVIFAIISAIAIFAGLRALFENKVRDETPMAFVEALKATLKNRSFLSLTAAQTMRFVTTNAMSAGMAFYVKYSLKLDEGQTAIILATAFIVSGLMQYPWRQLIANRFEARTTSMIGYAVVAVAVGTLWFANSLTSALVAAAIVGVGFAGIFLMDNILLSDVIDEDELNTGHRREGMYFGLNTFGTTLSTAIVAAAFAVIAPAYGYDTRLAVQPETVAMGFRVFMTALPVAGCLIALFVLWMYPLHGERLRAIKAALAGKRSSN
jgi:glycoside/pentoside/hexuronide:cation symporter, GPH family